MRSNPVNCNRRQALAGLVCRIILGGAFYYSGLIKITALPQEYALYLASYGIIPQKISLFAAYTLPWLELYLGSFILAGIATRICSIITACVILIAGAAAIYAWSAGLNIPDFHFLAVKPGRHPVIAVIDAVLLAAAAGSFAFGRTSFTIDSWARKGQK